MIWMFLAAANVALLSAFAAGPLIAVWRELAAWQGDSTRGTGDKGHVVPHD